MKKYKIIGKHFTSKHGYLCSHDEGIFVAINKKNAIQQARERFISCNRFIVEEQTERNNNE